jgi:hypothetical protein
MLELLAPSVATAATQIAKYETQSRTFPALLSAAPEERASWADVERSLRKLAILSDDWDEAGAAAPTAETVDTAIDFARYLRHSSILAPDIVRPTPDGCICIGWREGDYIREFEIGNGRLLNLTEYNPAIGWCRSTNIET